MVAPWARAAASTEATPGEPVRTVQTVGGRLLINGRPIFLTGIYGPLNDAAGVEWAVRKLGVDLVIEPGTDQSEAALSAAARGRYWIMNRSRPELTGVSRFSNTIAVSTLDEPETHGCPAGRCRFPSLPRLPVFANYNGWISWPGLWGAESTQATADDYRRYLRDLGPSAIVTQDDYFLSSGFSTEEAISASYNYMLAQVDLVRQVNENAVNGMYIETWPATTTNAIAEHLAPLFTPRVVVAEAKAAIVGGAQLVNWWAKPDATSPDVAAAVQQFTVFLHQHSELLTASRLHLASYQGAPVKRAGTRLVRGGRVVNTIMLMNVTDQPVVFTTRFPGLRDQQVVDLVTGRRVPARAGAITVTIPPQDWWLGSFDAGAAHGRAKAATA